MHMANAAEQTCSPDQSPAPWLHKVSRLGRDGRPFMECPPGVLDHCTVMVGRRAEEVLITEYGNEIAHIGLDWPDSAGESVPSQLVAEPAIWRGIAVLARGHNDEAAHWGRSAATLLGQWGTSWDKRLSLEQWLAVSTAMSAASGDRGDELCFVAGRIVSAAALAPVSPQHLYLEFATAGLLSGAGGQATPRGMPTAAQDGPQPRAAVQLPEHEPLPPRFQAYVAGFRSNHKSPRMRKYPGLPRKPWHDPQQFPIVRDLEAMSDVIAAEVRSLDRVRFQDEAEDIDRSGRWSVFFLYRRGRKNEDNCQLCPQTAAIFEAHRATLSLGGLVYFSVLDPFTHVAPHTGPTNMRLRCHLGIDVPTGCTLTVDGDTRGWEAGRCIVFDDSLMHEVWNPSPERRIVLIVDLWHPDLSDVEISLLRGFHRYVEANATRLARYWQRNGASSYSDY